MDPLMRKIFARVGFLQGRLWKDYSDETQLFFSENPDISILINKEMFSRGEQQFLQLPSMERPARSVFTSGPPPPGHRNHNHDDDLESLVDD